MKIPDYPSIAMRPALCAAVHSRAHRFVCAAIICGAWAAAIAFLVSPACAAAERIAKGGIEYVIDRPADWVVPAEMSIPDDKSAQSRSEEHTSERV